MHNFPEPTPDSAARQAGRFWVRPSPVEVCGQPAILLGRDAAPAFALREVHLLPGCGSNLWQIRAALPGGAALDLLAAPPLAEAAVLLAARDNTAFQHGGPLLIPFANRIRGAFDPATGSIRVEALGSSLPANNCGVGPAAEPHAIHGLFYARPFRVAMLTADDDRAVVETVCETSFGSAWPGRMEVRCRAELNVRELQVTITVRNTGAAVLPTAIGWHPHFRIPSGDRRQARLRLPARQRVLVDNRWNVFPTGEIEPVAGTAFDFREARPLDDLFLDDSFCGLVRESDGVAVAELHDPAAGVAIRLSTRCAAVNALHCYAPLDATYVAIEPQYNLADPFNSRIWRERYTGIAWLPPEGKTALDVTTRLIPI